MELKSAKELRTITEENVGKVINGITKDLKTTLIQTINRYAEEGRFIINRHTQTFITSHTKLVEKELIVIEKEFLEKGYDFKFTLHKLNEYYEFFDIMIKW